MAVHISQGLVFSAEGRRWNKKTGSRNVRRWESRVLQTRRLDELQEKQGEQEQRKWRTGESVTCLTPSRQRECGRGNKRWPASTLLSFLVALILLKSPAAECHKKPEMATSERGVQRVGSLSPARLIVQPETVR
ncbi:hypothetical protein NQZ68_017240 [Dissostichus eleginoides]|nr:hypothetical protein NQZ68_017240 [Dissostichus eleginoides]